MDKLATILIAFIAIEHIGFLILEMFLWERVAGRVFGSMPDGDASVAKVLAGNMGLYNGFLAAGLIWGLKQAEPATGLQIATFFLVCIVAAGAFGAYSVKPAVLLIQALPAAIALALLWAL